MALLDQMVFAFQTKDSDALEKVLRKITRRMKDITVAEKELEKTSDESGKKRLSKLKKEYSYITRLSALSRRRQSELRKDERNRESERKRKEAEKTRAIKTEQREKEKAHKDDLRREREAQKAQEERVSARKKALISVGATALIALKATGKTIDFINESIRKKARYNTAYGRVGGMSPDQAQGFDIALGAFGGETGEGLGFLANLTGKIGAIRYGDAGLLQALGKYGVGGIGGFSKPQDIIKAIASKAQGMDTFAQEAMFNELGIPMAMRQLIRSGRTDLFDLLQKPVSSLEPEEIEKLKTAGITDLEIEKAQMELASNIKVIANKWDEFVKNASDVAMYLKLMHNNIPSLIGAIGGLTATFSFFKKAFPLSPKVKDVAGNKIGVPIPKAGGKGSLPKKVSAGKGVDYVWNEKTGRYQSTGKGRPFVSLEKVAEQHAKNQSFWSKTKRFGGKALSRLGKIANPLTFAEFLLTPHTANAPEIPLGKVWDEQTKSFVPMPIDSMYGSSVTNNNGDTISDSYNKTENNYFFNDKSAFGGQTPIDHFYNNAWENFVNLPPQTQ